MVKKNRLKSAVRKFSVISSVERATLEKEVAENERIQNDTNMSAAEEERLEKRGSLVQHQGYLINPFDLKSEPELKRKASIASQYVALNSSDGFLNAVLENTSVVQGCREILQKPPRDRSSQELSRLQTLFESSKLMQAVKLSEETALTFYGSLLYKKYHKNEYIFREGDVGNRFYIIFSGKVSVRKFLEKDDDDDSTIESTKLLETTIVTLNAGDCFGERALSVANEKRTASILVESNDTEVVSISKAEYDGILKEATEKQSAQIKAMGRGGGGITGKRFKSSADVIREIFRKPKIDRTDEDLVLAMSYFRNSKFFSKFEPEIRTQLFKEMIFICAWSNTVLFEQGSKGHHFYIIFSGEVEVSINTKNRQGEIRSLVVATLTKGQEFGELALTGDESQSARSATIKSVQTTELLAISREVYQDLIHRTNEEIQARRLGLFETNIFFKHVDRNALEGMCKVMNEKHLPYDGVICKQGSRALETYVILRGEVAMKRSVYSPVSKKDVTVILGRYGKDSILGCVEASAGKFHDIIIRPASIVATSPVKYLVLSRFDIFHLMTDSQRKTLQPIALGLRGESVHTRTLKSLLWDKYKRDTTTSVVQSRVEKYPSTALSGKRIDPDKKWNPELAVPECETPTAVAACAISVLAPQSSIEHAIDYQQEISNEENTLGSLRNTTTTTSIKRHNRLSSGRRKSTLTYSRSMSSISSTSSSHRGTRKLSGNTTTNNTSNTSAEQQLKDLLINSSNSRMNRDKILSQYRQLFDIDNVVTSTTTTPTTNTESCVVTSSDSTRKSSLSGITSAAKAASKLNASSFVRASDTTTNTNLRKLLWKPVHGIYHPFALVGVATSVTKSRTPSAVSKPLRKKSIHKLSDDTISQEGRRAASVVVVAIRTFGKYRNLEEALECFKDICDTETKVVNPSVDTSSFQLYKDDSLSMDLRNVDTFVDPKEQEECSATIAPPPSNKSRRATSTPGAAAAVDITIQLPPSTLSDIEKVSYLNHSARVGQRFACISVKKEIKTSSVDNSDSKTTEVMHVHTYQCFPTAPSAIRYAKNLTGIMTSTMQIQLLVVPIMKWIRVEELDKYNPKSKSIERLLQRSIY